MCVILYKPAGVSVTRKTLKQCWTGNKDGGGFMWAWDGILFIEKGYFGFRKFYKAFRNNERTYPKADFVLHMRITSSGKTNAENCHPFYANKGCNVGMAHNGVLFKYSALKSDYSDTQVFVKIILHKLPHDYLHNEALKTLLDDYCKANASKMIFMDRLGKVFIANEIAGEWDNGIWFSNKIFKYANMANDYYDDRFGFASYAGHSYNPDVTATGRTFNVNKFSSRDLVKCSKCGGWFIEADIVESSKDYNACKDCMEWNSLQSAYKEKMSQN